MENNKDIFFIFQGIKVSSLRKYTQLIKMDCRKNFWERLWNWPLENFMCNLCAQLRKNLESYNPNWFFFSKKWRQKYIKKTNNNFMDDVWRSVCASCDHTDKRIFHLFMTLFEYYVDIFIKIGWTNKVSYTPMSWVLCMHLRWHLWRAMWKRKWKELAWLKKEIFKNVVLNGRAFRHIILAHTHSI